MEEINLVLYLDIVELHLVDLFLLSVFLYKTVILFFLPPPCNSRSGVAGGCQSRWLQNGVCGNVHVQYRGLLSCCMESFCRA